MECREQSRIVRTYGESNPEASHSDHEDFFTAAVVSFQTEQMSNQQAQQAAAAPQEKKKEEKPQYPRPNYDLETYLSNYQGHGRTYRLKFIGEVTERNINCFHVISIARNCQLRRSASVLTS